MADAPGLGDVLVRLAAERPGLLVITGADAGPAAWFAEVWPERVLTVPPVSTRLAVGEGVVRAGGQAVVVLEEDVSGLPTPPARGVVLASTSAAHLVVAHRSGAVVVQPGWAEDLPDLLRLTLSHDVGVLLHLPVPPDGPRPDGLPPPALDGPRVLRAGASGSVDGLVVGAGATAALAAAVGQALQDRDHDVTCLAMTAITPGSGIDPALLHTHLLVGPRSSPRVGAMTAVEADDDQAAVVERVRGALTVTGRADDRPSA